jgi:hypothetical protein
MPGTKNEEGYYTRDNDADDDKEQEWAGLASGLIRR